MVAIIAHALALINNKYFGGDINAERVAVIALYHDATEIITGDLPTPIKYYSPEIKSAYNSIEAVAKEKLVSMLPEKLKNSYIPIINADEEDKRIYSFVKAADTISAYIKCVEESKTGSGEFDSAKKTILEKINNNPLPEVKVFMEEFMQGFSLNLDEQ